MIWALVLAVLILQQIAVTRAIRRAEAVREKALRVLAHVRYVQALRAQGDQSVEVAASRLLAELGIRVTEEAG